MSKRTVRKEVVCCFYGSETKETVYCEGVEDGTAIHLAFDSVRHKRDYQKKFCCCKYKSCLLASMLLIDKYADG